MMSHYKLGLRDDSRHLLGYGPSWACVPQEAAADRQGRGVRRASGPESLPSPSHSNIRLQRKPIAQFCSIPLNQKYLLSTLQSFARTYIFK